MISKLIKILVLAVVAILVVLLAVLQGGLWWAHKQEVPSKSWVGSPVEQRIIDEMVQAVIEKQRKEREPGTVAKRDVHTKSHGTFKAKFRVLDGLPSELKVGLFAKGGEYDALVRFSNGAMKADGFDALPNVRGVAIKLHGVSGEKVLPGDEKSTEQDFLMANDEVFFAPGIEDMHKLVRGEMGPLLKQNPRVGALIADSVLKVVTNPLETDYYSQVPYAFGPQGEHRKAVKYALLRTSSSFSVPNVFDRHYLRHAAVHSLNKGTVTMTFAVQFQQAGEQIEDSSHRWIGKYIPVAELVFEKVEGTVKESAGEELSFNPVRSLPEHEPLGWPGRVRKSVYPADFKWRTEENINIKR